MKKSNLKIISIASIIVIVLLISLFFITRTSTAETLDTSIIKIDSDNQKIQQLEKHVKELENKLSELETKVNTIILVSTSTPIPTIEKAKETPKTTINDTSKAQEIKTVKKKETKNTTIVDKNVSSDTKKVKVNTIITEKSGLSADQIDQLLTYILTVKYNKKDSKLLGQGKALYEMEQNNEVNAFYALAVATFETGWGCQGVSGQNNLFAFASDNGYKKYASVEDSIKNFGAHSRDYYFNKKSLTSVSEVAPVYCPPNSDEWIYQVNWLIEFYSKTAKTILQN